MTNKISKIALEVFTIEVPTKQEGVFKFYHYTTADRPVTYNGQQYIPLADCDAAALLTKGIE